MAFHLAIRFPSEAEALRKHLQAEQRLTPTERLLAVADALAAAEALSLSGGVRAAQLRYHQGLEDDWRRRMKEFVEQPRTAGQPTAARMMPPTVPAPIVPLRSAFALPSFCLGACNARQHLSGVNRTAQSAAELPKQSLVCN